MSKRITDMTDDELCLVAGDDEHPLCDEALDELTLRESCAWDSRIAQATGRAVGESPS